MERGLYIAASGMMAEMVRQDQITNDLANASTPGYKADRSTQRSFGDLLLSNSVTGREVGPLGLGARVDSIVTDLAPGPTRDTGEPLDFAIAGQGYFAVRGARGVQYTRNGQFGVSAQGDLITSQGAQVLGQNGAPVRVGPGGRVAAAQIGVFGLNGARKVGDSMFAGAVAGRAQGTIRAGALEGSNADPARAMVDEIASYRNFESGQKVIRTIDETLQKAATQVGSIS
ncbi:MAG: flagellar basal-body rod protein FlgF [Thermoleophilaceae bacterium]